MGVEKQLKILMGALNLYRYNFRIMHWKSKGKQFKKVHELMADYYEMLDGFIDEIAEISLMFNIEPLSYEDTLTVLNASDLQFEQIQGRETFDCIEAVKKSGQFFNQLISLYEDVKKDMPGDITSKLEEHQYTMRLESQYKGKMTLME